MFSVKSPAITAPEVSVGVIAVFDLLAEVVILSTEHSYFSPEIPTTIVKSMAHLKAEVKPWNVIPCLELPELQVVHHQFRRGRGAGETIIPFTDVFITYKSIRQL